MGNSLKQIIKMRRECGMKRGRRRKRMKEERKGRLKVDKILEEKEGEGNTELVQCEPTSCAEGRDLRE